MPSEDRKTEISTAEAASVFAYGNKTAVPDLIADSDEFFILRFTYADTDYIIRANGELDLSDDIPKLTVALSIPDGVRIERSFLDAFSALTASALMRDRGYEPIELCVKLRDEYKEREFTTAYNFSLGEKALGRIIRKLHRKLFAEEEFIKSAAPTLKTLKFPYKTIREGQELFLRKAYSAIRRSSVLFVEAPTGIGKTMSALYAAVRALGDGFCDKIFYLTAKGSVSSEAYKACEKLFSVGARIRCIRIEAKGKLCPMHSSDTFECEAYKCPLMKGYSERSEDAIYDLINSRYGFTPEVVAETARIYNVCPYELSLDLSELCPVVICDYNYAFDPRVRIRRYFDDQAPGKKYVFLIDEAHNLVSRAKEMYSSSVSMSDVRQLYSEIIQCEKEGGASETITALKRSVNAFASALKRASHLCDDSAITDQKGIRRGFYLANEPYSKLTDAADVFEKALSEFKRSSRQSVAYDCVSDFLSDFSGFSDKMKEPSDGMKYYISLEGEEICAKCMCVDPAHPIGERLRFASSTVFFSATLTPMEYYTKTLSGGRNPSILTLKSPFDKDKLFCAAYTNVSTRYEDREKNARRIMSVITSVLSAKKGNYMLYFPSYGYMSTVYEKFTQKYPKVHTIIQRYNMSFSERKAFMDFFSDDTSCLRVGFCVLGGSFSEGIDLPGNRLIGTVIIGVGLPGLSSEQNIIKEYYDHSGVDGFDFAYTFPGMNNVLQAAGRVIRSEDDAGVVIFVDDRYANEKYMRIMPERFSHMEFYEDAAELSEDIGMFWRKN